MKLNLVKYNAATLASTPQTNADALKSIDFTKKDNTTYEAAVPIRLPKGTGSTIAALSKVTVVASAEKSKAGVMRLLCKVNVPYMALSPNVVAGVQTNSQFDPARSGKDITAHVVMTIPKAAVEDLRGQRVGTDGVACAQAQVGLVRALLATLWGSLTGVTGKSMAPFTVNTSTAELVPNTYSPGDDRTGNNVTYEPAVVNDIEGYAGIDGLDATHCGADLSDPDSFLTRALIGLAPVNENATLGYKAQPVRALA